MENCERSEMQLCTLFSEEQHLEETEFRRFIIRRVFCNGYLMSRSVCPAAGAGSKADRGKTAAGVQPNCVG